MNELKPEDVMRAIAELRKHGLSNGGGLGYHAGWCEEVADLLENLLALLREKDAESERLTKERDDARRDCAVAEQNHYECKKELETARADAITEFAERLKQCTECMGECTVDNPLAETYSVVREEYIDQIAKELTDDFPNCKISGCEAARKDCHIDCPYGKENKNENS